MDILSWKEYKGHFGNLDYHHPPPPIVLMSGAYDITILIGTPHSKIIFKELHPYRILRDKYMLI